MSVCVRLLMSPCAPLLRRALCKTEAAIPCWSTITSLLRWLFNYVDVFLVHNLCLYAEYWYKL